MCVDAWLAAVGLSPVAISVVAAFAVPALLGVLACRAAADSSSLIEFAHPSAGA